MSNPIRVQRKRTKGWKAPENTINVTRPGKWGNPFMVGDIFGTKTTDEAVKSYEDMLLNTLHGNILINHAKIELKGKNLMCFCSLDQPCHADVLLKLANS